MSDDFDDLLSPAATTDVAARRARRREVDPLAREVRLAASGKGSLRATDFMKPVTQQFLAEVFGMDPATVKKRLVTCPVLGEGGGNRRVYDFKTACSFLLKPRMDEATFLKTLNHADMPPILNKVVWEAKRIKLKYEIEAGQAWATEDVIEVLGRVFMAVKSHSQLWAESMRELGLDDATMKKVEGLVDGFSSELHQELVDMPKQRQTRSKIAELEQELLGGVPAFDEED
ncbi:hypothetical protein I5E68_09995 [Novosphingobium sp. YJ-S2-02]|uniref:Terminase small subunit n=1 Tax=Novosphingobium aureum TaxID=2792964 RepID=A0A931HC21_9SPHN|nr:hypothetical protein [Novosphingobium aureum]MBH0113277.1 hypothetical protein [Novosphingobium aureum]